MNQSVLLGLGLAFFSCVFASCSTSVPMTATSDDGQQYSGLSMAGHYAFSEFGKFELASEDGTQVSGTYDDLDIHTIIPLRFQTSDGRQGNGVIYRAPGEKWHRGIGSTEDGTGFRFVIGNVAKRGPQQLTGPIPPA